MVTYNDVDYFYVYNLQGDVVALIDANGTQVVEYVYDAWGYPISKTGSLAATIGTLNPFRYRGYVYDEETGLYYLRSRYYNPGWKRFVNADRRLGEEGEWILGHDSYTYCFNNPVSLIDPKGEFVLPIVVLPSDITNKAIQTNDDIEFDCGFVIASNVNVGPPDGYYSYKNNRGDLYEIWYDSEGKAKHSRHHSNHGNASKHQKIRMIMIGKMMKKEIVHSHMRHWIQIRAIKRQKRKKVQKKNRIFQIWVGLHRYSCPE